LARRRDALSSDRVRFLVFPDLRALARFAAEAVLDSARSAVGERERFSIALSGGTTPGALFDLLAGPFRDRIPWVGTHVFWVDERFVPPDHEQSNFGTAHGRLLRHVPVPQSQVLRYAVELDTPEAAARAYETALRGFFGDEAEQSFDLTLLGMGQDGHTASLFPRALAEGTLSTGSGGPWVESVVAPPGHAVAQRLTLTLPVLNRTRRVLFLVAGERKRPAVQRVRSGEGRDLPASLVHAREETLWLLDEPAAGSLGTRDARMAR
jgi:6-phosphogluconolactonase